AASSDLRSEVVTVDGVQLLVKAVDGVESKELRGMIDQLKDQLTSAVIVLATASGDKVSVAAGVTKDLTDRFKAGEIVSLVCSRVGGKGGGRPDMAMGGGSDVAALPSALEQVLPWIKGQLN